MISTRENILALRAAGFSQTRISEMTGIPQPRLSRWEGGDVPQAADDALKLAVLVANLDPAFLPRQGGS